MYTFEERLTIYIYIYILTFYCCACIWSSEATFQLALPPMCVLGTGFKSVFVASAFYLLNHVTSPALHAFSSNP